MNAAIGSTGASPYQAIGDLLLHREALDGAVPPSLDVPGLDEWSDAEYRTRELLVEQLRARLADVRVPLDHPIRRSVRSVWTATATADLARRAEAARAATLEVRSIAGELAGALGIEPPRDRAGAEAIVELARPPRDGRDLGDVPLGDDDWERRGADVDDLLTAGGSLAALHDRYDEVLLPEAWGRDLVETRETLNTVGRRWWRRFSGRQQVAVFRLATLCRGTPPRRPDERLALVDAIVESQRKRSVIQRHACLAGRLFGSRWRGETVRLADPLGDRRPGPPPPGVGPRGAAAGRGDRRGGGRGGGPAGGPAGRSAPVVAGRAGRGAAVAGGGVRAGRHRRGAAGRVARPALRRRLRPDRRGGRPGRRPARRRAGQPAGRRLPRGRARGRRRRGPRLARRLPATDRRLPGPPLRGPARPGRPRAAGAGRLLGRRPGGTGPPVRGARRGGPRAQPGLGGVDPLGEACPATGRRPATWRSSGGNWRRSRGTCRSVGCSRAPADRSRRSSRSS